MKQKPILVGAVIYDPKVSVIWDIIAEFFRAEGCDMDTVFYTNYELQVDALLAGHIDIAWNSPLAWLDAERKNQCRAIAMRDTDRDRRTHIIVRRADAFKNLSDLRGKTLATGAEDSPQATLLPIHLLYQHGLEPGKDYIVQRHDVMVGKHGDHVGGELQALQSLQAGTADASAVLDLNWERWQKDGTADGQALTSLGVTEPFDHCNFTVLESFPQANEQRWLDVLYRMSYENPAHREMMDMEGLKAWLPGRVSGYKPLELAVQEQKFFGDVTI